MRKKRRMKYRLVRRRAIYAIKVPKLLQMEVGAVSQVRPVAGAFGSLMQILRQAAEQVKRAFALPAWLVQTSAH